MSKILEAINCVRDDGQFSRNKYQVKLADEAEEEFHKLRKEIAKLKAAEHRVHQTAGGRRSKKSKVVVPAAGNA